MSTTRYSIKIKTFGIYIAQFVLIILFCVLIKITCIEIVYIPSGSMEDTIYTGDYILVNKLYYGARLPRNILEVPWLNFFGVIFGDSNYIPNYSKNVRIKGFSSIKRNDILVFNQPLSPDNLFIKRCVGIPGDIVQCQDTSIILNYHLLKDNPLIKYNYYVKFKNGIDQTKAFADLGISYNEDWFERKNLTKTINITNYGYNTLKKSQLISKLWRRGLINDSVVSDVKKNAAMKIYKIPYKGLTVVLNKETITEYGEILSLYENLNLSFLNQSSYEIKSRILRKYTFKHNYYFMLGDNRDNSIDSRYWGLLPEYFIVGKASIVALPNRISDFKRYFTRL